MNKNREKHYEVLASSVIKNMKLRQMEGFYFKDLNAALDKISGLIKEKSTVSWGGTMTCEDIGLFKHLKNRNDLVLLDRSLNQLPESEFFAKVFLCDSYIMSSNAITYDGKLVNTDGKGNRVSSLIFGPKQVIVVAGMNKVVKDEQSAIDRIKYEASPVNCHRLNKNTPCAVTGKCEDCQSSDCICTNTVITRRSHIKNRIKVILIGKDLGF